MRQAEIHSDAGRLLSGLEEELPSLQEYIFVDINKLEKLVLRLNHLSAREQEILLSCIKAVKCLATKQLDENSGKVNYDHIFHSVVNSRGRLIADKKQFVSLLGSIFSMQGIIKRQKRGAVVSHYKGRALKESHPLV